MGLGLQRDDTLHFLHLEIVAGALVFRGKLLDDRTLRESYVILIGRENLVGILFCGLLNHVEEARLHLLAVDDEHTAENLVAAVLGVDLGKTEDFGVGQRTAQLLFHLMQVFYFFRTQGQTFLLVVFLQVGHVLDGLRLDVHREDVLVQSCVHTLQHRVVISVLTADGEVFLDALDALEAHVLRDFHGIGTPRSNHFTSRTHKESVEGFTVNQRGITIEPAKFLDFLFVELMVHLRGNHALFGSLEEKNHNLSNYCYILIMCAKVRISEHNTK